MSSFKMKYFVGSVLNKLKWGYTHTHERERDAFNIFSSLYYIRIADIKWSNIDTEQISLKYSTRAFYKRSL